MILSVPLVNCDAPSQVTVSRHGWDASKTKLFPSLSVSYSGTWFLASDGFQTVMCSLELEDSYRIHGTLLFRQYERDASMLCLVETNGAVCDFALSQPSTPLPVSVKNVHVNGGSAVVHVSFLPSDEALMISSGGSLGAVHLDPQRCLSTGYSGRCGNLYDIVCGGVVPDSSLVVVLTRGGLCGVVDIRESVLLSVTQQSLLSELGPPVSCLPMMGSEADAVDIVVTYPSSRTVCVFTTSRKSDGKKANHESHFIGVSAESRPLSSYAHSYDKSCGSCSLVVSVWRDLLQFSVKREAKLRVVALMENEMSVPYVSGCWVGDVFVVTRADGMALPFSVRLNENNANDLVIEPHRHIALASCSSSLLCGHSDYFMLLTLTNVESLWSSTPGPICVTDSNSQRRSLRLCEVRAKVSDTLLIDIILFSGNIAVINVKRSGECVAIIPSSSEVTKLFLAHEKEPDKVTSCLLYKRRENIFVTGHEHGSVHVWISGKLKSVVHMVHTGVVNKILMLPAGNERIECDFISVCTERGTVAFHHSGTFECTRVLQAPCAPLTSLIWDQQTEYAFAVSGSVGNLWHVPTCRLERLFHVSSVITDASGYRDLLACSSEVGPVTVDRIAACGGIHFSLVVNILGILEVLTLLPTGGIPSPACRLALSILFSGASYMDAELPALLNLPERGLSGGMFKIQVVSSGQSETYLLATVILMKTLKASAGPDSSIGMPEIKALIDSLVSSGHLEKPPRPENLIIEALPLLLQLTEPAKGAVRIAVSAAAQQLTSPQLHDLLSHLLFITAEESSVRRWFGIPNALGDFSMWCYELFVQAALLSEIPFGKDDRDAVMKSALHKFGEGASRLHEALATIKEESCIQILLGTVGEYYPFLASNVLADPRPLVDAVATLAFESDGGTRTLALKTLVSIAVTEEKRFIDNRVEKWYKEKRLWRPHLIAFFGNLIVSSPVNSYASFPTMTTFLLRALDPHNPNRDEHDSCVVPVTQVIRVAVNCLPNVSFQQHLQYLAVGNTDGIVQVINLKTTGIVASFVSHPEAILCVSYSSNTSSHDIAVLSEKMETVKIWRASRTANVLSAIFAGHMTEFRLRFTVDIPSFDRNLSISCERFLLINKCRLRWLSPHCVELSSPWHDRIQLAVQ